MTTLQIVESVKQIFPKLLESQIIAEMNTAQDKFARETQILRKVGLLEDITLQASWGTPTDLVELYEVQLYDSNGKALHKVNENIDWLVDGKRLIFYDTDSDAKITTIPTSISYIWTRYSHLPTVLIVIDVVTHKDHPVEPILITTDGSHNLITGDTVIITGVDPVTANGTWTITRVSATTFSIPVATTGNYTSGGLVKTALTIDTQFTEAVLAGVLETLYARIPTSIITKDGEILAINFNAAKYWRDKYKEIKIDAKKWINSIDSTERRSRHYQHSGLYSLPKEAKDVYVSTTTWEDDID